MFKDMRIGTRLFLGFGLVFAIMGVILLAASLLMNGVIKSSRHVEQESLPYALMADRMVLDTVQVQEFLTDVSATHNREALAEAENSAKSFRAGLSKFLSMYEKENDRESLRLLGEIEERFNKFGSSRKSVGHFISP